MVEYRNKSSREKQERRPTRTPISLSLPLLLSLLREEVTGEDAKRKGRRQREIISDKYRGMMFPPLMLCYEIQSRHN
ncbi:hypothetical protein J6590_078241 [Homalodisca vitripennis]|nr:hypothetical protein J6590_078241 [Homalodisca vitripennis]